MWFIQHHRASSVVDSCCWSSGNHFCWLLRSLPSLQHNVHHRRLDGKILNYSAIWKHFLLQQILSNFWNKGHPNMTSTFLRGGGMSSLPCSTRFTKSDGWEKSFILLPYEKRPKSNFCNIFWVFWNMYITLKIILWYDCIKVCSAYFASVIWVKWKQSFYLCIVAV